MWARETMGETHRLFQSLGHSFVYQREVPDTENLPPAPLIFSNTSSTSECIWYDEISFKCWSKGRVLCQEWHGTKRESAMQTRRTANIWATQILAYV